MTYTEPDLRDLRATMAVCARPRYANMADPHDGNDAAGQPAIRLVNYMGDLDSYYETNLVGPYSDEAARNADLTRLRGLPLGAPEYNGGYEFLASSMAAAKAGWDRTVVLPEKVAAATTVRDFFAAFWGFLGEDENERRDAVHPDQTALDL